MYLREYFLGSQSSRRACSGNEVGDDGETHEEECTYATMGIGLCVSV